MKEYIFGLFKDGMQIDQTALDENNKNLAMELFKDFSFNEEYTIDKNSKYYVELIETRNNGE